ncbi:MAG: hypothetical protein ACI9LA_002092 [Bacteroidia bacterium]|jgi:hypothetical protein
MRILTFLFSIFFAVNVLAQPISDLVVYTTESDPFFLILNGVKQNEEAMTNVRVTDLNQLAYDARVVFERSKVQVDKKIFFGDAGMEYVYKIKAKKNGELTLRPQSATALNLAQPAPSNQQTIVYHTTPAPVPVQQSVITTTTTSTTSQSTSMNNGGGVNMSLGVPGVNVNVNMNDPFLGTQQGGVTYTESVTTTTTTAPAIEPVYEPDHYVMPGYNGSIGCPWPMSNGQFSDALRSVSSKSFDDEKATVAKQITGSNCLTVEQAKTMMMELSFDSAKLEYAKFAYDKTYDVGNYYKLNDAFDFSSNVDELNEYINGH